MSVPEFYRFIRPSLEALKDGQEISIVKMGEILAHNLGLTPEDVEELTASGATTRLKDRTQWALTYLRQAQLIEIAGRGISRITPRGLQYLPTAPQVIKTSDLLQFPEFAAFRQKSAPKSNGIAIQEAQNKNMVSSADEKTTPDDTIAAAYKEQKAELAQEILERVKEMPPAFFERLIVQLMLRLGYGSAVEDAGKTLGKSGDGGVDGVIKQDKLGLDNIYLQAKRWDESSVGSKEIQAFVGALSGHGASKGVFITTSSFTKAALDYARNNHAFKLSLVDGIELATLMVDHDLGVSLVSRYDVKRIDSDFFSES